MRTRALRSSFGADSVQHARDEAVPFITHIQSPRKMSFWAVSRPVEVDDDEEQLIDIGDGVFAPKRSIAKLRRLAALRDKNARKLPAENGRMSLLQAAV